MKCPHCQQDNPDGLNVVEIDQTPMGDSIYGAGCTNCGEIVYEIPEGCQHPTLDWQRFCTSCGVYVGEHRL